MHESIPYSLNINGHLVELAEPQVMGILNATPDSFYAGSRQQTEEDIAVRTEQLQAEGADFIDVGAYSTRPGALLVTEEEETERLRRALTIVRRIAPNARVSLDTFRARVAERMVGDFGVGIINDVSGGNDPDMFATVARLGVPYVLTHSPLGFQSKLTASPESPENPNDKASSPTLAKPFIPSLLLYFSERIDALLALGQKDIILDPGFGFGKSFAENYELLMHLDELQVFGLPLLVGVSRKSMIYRLLDILPEEALNGTTVLHTLALERGANILRVHDVAPCKEVIKIMKQCSSPLA